MIDIGIFYNGSLDIPTKAAPNGIVIPDASLAEIHESCQRGIVAAIRQGILADKLGFDYWWQTEHHFQIEGAEFNPNPILTQMAIAAHTRRIRIGQATNVITMHNPVRLAEQVATLDIASGGRCELGVGRGYQPREVEIMGRPYGATIQDQERNRSYFEEAFEVLIKAFTELSFGHHGENLSFPPTYTKWHHAQTIAYLEDGKAERTVDQVLALGKPDMYSGGNPVIASTTRLLEMSVFPQTIQKPHPQLWMPMTSDRTIRLGAEKGMNGQFFAENNSRLKRNIQVYMEEAERLGWPDMYNRGEFKFGWDSQKKRGITPGRWVHMEMGKLGCRERFMRGIQHGWDYYGPFGFAAVFAEAGEAPWPVDTRITAEIVEQKELGVCGSPQKIIDVLMRCKEECGYEDFAVNIDFEVAGIEASEVEDQMQAFAEEVMPVLRRECGGGPDLPATGIDFNVEPRAPGSWK